MITEQEINDAYADLDKNRELLFSQAQVLANAEQTLKDAKAKGLVDGMIVGRNAEAREASAREQLEELYTDLDAIQLAYDRVRKNYDLAHHNVERIRLIVRLMEITK